MTSRFIISFTLAFIAGSSLMVNAAFHESFSMTRHTVVLLFLVAFHLLKFPFIVFCRELGLYIVFAIYIISSLLWVDGVTAEVAAYTLNPVINFILIFFLYSSFIRYYDQRAVFAGSLFGFLIVAIGYSIIEGFPFIRPADFSYNAISSIYLFGLFITLLFSCYERKKMLLLLMVIIIMLHIMATTSIKTNLGIFLGMMAISLLFFRTFFKIIGRKIIPIIILTGMVLFGVVSNNQLNERVQAGVERVVLGLEILESNEQRPGYGGYDERKYWKNEGLSAWMENPWFGNGIQAFRINYGTTSHSTPIDLLYNYGLIGFVLFYAMFASLIWRLFQVYNNGMNNFRAVILGFFVCYLFISISGTMHYNVFLAAFFAISAAILQKNRKQNLKLTVEKNRTIKFDKESPLKVEHNN